jgi:DNA-binding transcriptional regulator LsrR (DeoR family)
VASDLDQLKLMFKIAQAYYEDGLTQEQIGRRLGLSRIKVSRMLRQAREEGVVRIAIVPPQASNVELERELERAYGLDEALVVSPPERGQDTALIRALGAAAAACLVRGLQGHEVVGLTWGTTVLAVVDALPRQNWPEMRVVQMLGGLGQPEADVYGADLARRMAEAFGARPRLLPAPGIVASKMVRDALLTDPQIADTLILASSADVALVGIGRPIPGSVLMRAGTILTSQELEQLQSRGAVGDIGLRFIDAQGRPVDHEINERIIGLDLGQMRRIPRVIGVAGTGKFEVIRAALRGRLLDVLVTDQGSAARLLQDRQPAGPR